MNLEELRIDCAVRQKKGLHFILASVVIWCAVLIVHLSSLPIETKNFLTFCFTAPLVPLAYLISRFIKVDFQSKSNPINNLGLLFSVNQILYLLIAMWVYPTVPDKMLMVIAMIFGAHLMPYSWLYLSKSYFVLSIVIPVMALAVGCLFPPYILAVCMVIVEVLFSIVLIFENRKIKKTANAVRST